MDRRICAGILAALLTLSAGCAASGGEEGTVSVQAVSSVADSAALGAANRYAGKVVSGQSAEIKKDDTKTILETLVAEGDIVAEGDVLFRYDTEAMQLELDKMQLELDGYDSTIAYSQEEITNLTNQRAKADSSQTLAYTLQIETLQADIREAEYNRAVKQKELESLQADMGNADVTAPIAGRVMTVAEDGNTGESGAYITLMDTETLRIEGNINELNLYDLTEGMAVLIRSRIDESLWHGTISGIDWENPVQENSNNYYYYSETDSMTNSTKYPFYVELEDAEGLLLGQHVYIEPDLGQEQQKEGLWLPAGFVVAENDSYVWAADDRDRLEKRAVELGEYDGTLDEYEILSGLTITDWIAYPDAALSVGQSVSYYETGSDRWEDYSWESDSWEDYSWEDYSWEDYSWEFDSSTWETESYSWESDSFEGE